MAGALSRWAAEEMKYLPEGKFAKSAPPSANDMKSLCRGASIPFWDYVSHRVKSEKTVLHVKQNIELAKAKREVQSEALKKAERLAKLKAKKEALQGQIAATREVICTLGTQTRRTHLDLASSEREMTDFKRKIEEHDVKVVLLETYEKQLSRTQTLLNEYHHRLDTRLSQLIASQTTPEKSNASEQNATNEGDAILKEIYDSICAHLESTTASANLDSHGLMEAVMTTLPNEIQEKLMTLASQHPFVASSLVARLAHIMSDETKQLEQATEKLDLKTIEAMALEQLETESLGQASHTALHGARTVAPKNTASARSPRAKKSVTGAIFPTVEELLETQRQEHVARYLTSEKYLNSAHALAQQRDKLLESIGRLDSYLRDFGEISISKSENSENFENASQGVGSEGGSKVSLQQRLQNLELAFCGEEAAYEASCAIVERLSESKRRYEHDLGVLKEKFNRIQELESENKERQLMCSELLRMNGGMKEMFAAQTEALRSFISLKLVDMQREMQASKQEEEDKSLNAAMISRDIAALHQYSMISAAASETELLSSLPALLEALNLRAHQSMDGLVDSVAKSLLDMQSVANAHIRRKGELDAVVASFAQWNDETAIKGLEAQFEQLEKTQSEVWLPILENAIGQVNKATERCASIMQLCSDLIKQPAQHFAPWLQLNGKTFEETIKSWKSLVHQLRPQK